MKNPILKLATIAAIAAASTSQAAVLYQSGFESSEGFTTSPSALNGQQGWASINYSGATPNNTDWNVVTGGLSVTSGNWTISGGDQKIAHTTGTGDIINSDSVGTAITATNVWMRFTVNADADATSPFFMMGLKYAASGPTNDNYFLGIKKNSNTNTYQARARDNSTNTDSTGSFTLATGTSGVIVMLLEKNTLGGGFYDRVTAWLNPDLSFGATAPTGGISAQRSTGYASMTYIYNRNNPGDVAFDNIVIADDFASLTVPEPTTWALLAGSLTTLMVFRRRRRIE